MHGWLIAYPIAATVAVTTVTIPVVRAESSRVNGSHHRVIPALVGFAFMVAVYFTVWVAQG